MTLGCNLSAEFDERWAACSVDVEPDVPWELLTKPLESRQHFRVPEDPVAGSETTNLQRLHYRLNGTQGYSCPCDAVIDRSDPLEDPLILDNRRSDILGWQLVC